ncbi:FtsB family cell division protein [Garciella nitratireducens]|uniref:Cell division protein FtsL n=1 Tax=Garciella nitratireducens DSM 15102 TaxID=1121911 RepID=A0A1T4L595_9FIRM|nr:septum formation initiator family protein [Garciella nitratireducens]RBP35477.1 cell division protein FtsL [Garciella nitratireducens]SJZ49895.1 cell division protein FtsL [Garciella nitratireducens DSM 15102]
MSQRNYKKNLRGNRRNKKKKLKRSTFLFLLFLFGYFGFRYISLQMQYHELEQKKAQLQMEVNQARTYQEQLSEQLKNSDSPKYIEDLARKHLGLVYPDEKVYIKKEKNVNQ